MKNGPICRKNADPSNLQGYGRLCWVSTYPCWGSLAPAGRAILHHCQQSSDMSGLTFRGRQDPIGPHRELGDAAEDNDARVIRHYRKARD